MQLHGFADFAISGIATRDAFVGGKTLSRETITYLVPPLLCTPESLEFMNKDTYELL